MINSELCPLYRKNEMKNTDLITGDYFYLNNDFSCIYMITEAGTNYAPLLTTNNPILAPYIGAYFPIKLKDKINYSPNFHFLSPTLIDYYDIFKYTVGSGEPITADSFQQGDYWIFNNNLNLKLSEHLNLIVHSKNPDLIGTFVKDNWHLEYKHSTTFKPDFNWIIQEGFLNKN